MADHETVVLKDLGKLAEKIRNKIKDFNGEDVRLSDSFKLAFAKNINNSGVSIEFKETTAIITNAQGQKIYAPNQWFLLAAVVVDLVIEINRYKVYTEKVVDELAKKASSLTKQKIYDKLKNDNEDIDNLKKDFKDSMFEYLKNEGMEENIAEKNTDLLYKFVSNYNWWYGGKGIERADFDISPILGVLNLVNASQGYVATITKAYLDDEKLHNELSTIIDSEPDGNMNLDFDEGNGQVFQGRATGLSTDFERNRIVFGAPGTGKSYKLKKDSEKLLKNNNGTFERVTFHPDYSYSQFVGTYKPVTDSSGEISYKFVPGPFMRVYVKAIKNPNKPYLLLIEEINRAKVASVFGDVFQLLDRDEEGVSEYDIQTSEDVKKYLIEELGEGIASCDKMKIPSNMFIWATMNSADQGVFPMDTAFKRRWNFEYLGINENEDKLECGLITLGKGETTKEINWNQLRRAINEKLATDYKLNEDKLMGPFFLSKSVIKGENNDKFIDAFKNKVIMYLYEDAAKQHKSKLFSGCDSTKYSSVCHAFDEKGIRIFGEDFIALYEQQEG